mgnify:FL=1|jgi:hypothetical protein
MPIISRHRRRLAAPVFLVAVASLSAAGCGTTRWTDSKRTATEQMLVSDAVERAVATIDMRPLAGYSVFLDTSFLDDVTDSKYLTSTLRHQLLASGCRLAASRDTAEVVVEARAGALGTDRSDLLIGIPATNVQMMGSGTSLPEIAAAKRTDQRAVAKVNLFAYDRASGRPVWQSGMQHMASNTRDRWLMGAGPFQDGDIQEQMALAGTNFGVPWRKQKFVEQTNSLAVAGQVDLGSPKVFASLPPKDSAADDHPITADERPQDLPPVR